MPVGNRELQHIVKQETGTFPRCVSVTSPLEMDPSKKKMWSLRRIDRGARRKIKRLIPEGDNELCTVELINSQIA